MRCECAADNVQTHHKTGHPDDPLRIDRPPEVTCQHVCDGTGKGGGWLRISKNAVLDALGQGIDDARRGPEIHVCDPQWNYIAAAVFFPFAAGTVAPVRRGVELKLHVLACLD